MEFKINLPILSVRSRRGLVSFADSILQQEGSADRMGVDPGKLHAFVQAVSLRYRKNPYHNFHHAVDVTNSMGWLVTRPVFNEGLPVARRLLLMVAALTHDADHPGHDNHWEVNTASSLALQYNNAAVLENHSVRVTAELMEKPEQDVFSCFGPAERREAFDTLNELILATDFAIHQQFLRELSAGLRRKPYNFSDPEFLNLISRALIKAADISNSAKPFYQANVWGRRVMREHWAQGDKEKKQNLPVSPHRDRDQLDLNAAQALFIKNAALGLFEALSAVEDQIAGCVVMLRKNQQHYEARAARSRRSVE